MNNTNPIGVFDSGIGGATVLKEILKVLPYENYIYYSDSKNNPYGDRKKEEIVNICDDIVQNLLRKKCKAIVIACNTASANSANELRKKYPNIPIIAIEPAYKMVHDLAYDENTLVMATKGTIESEKFTRLYHKYDNHKTTLLKCEGLAELIENDKKEEIASYLHDNLKEFREITRNVVLGCTHYPLIEDEIKDVLGDVRIFNGAPNLAKHLYEVLEQAGLLNNSTDSGNINFIDSSNSTEKKQRFFQYLM